MSQENVELAKRMSEAGKRGDVEAAMQFLAEDVVAVEFGDRLDTANVFHGRKALVDYYAQIADVFEGLVREIDELVDSGDWTIVVGHWVGKGQSSGVRSRDRELPTPLDGGRGRSSSTCLTSKAKRRLSERYACGSRRCRGRTSRVA
jgi:ketosteroid isomerase-like protein